MHNPRLLATQVLTHVLQGRSLSHVLPMILKGIQLHTRDKALVQAICFGVCRYYPRLNYLLSMLLHQPLKAADSDLYALLLVGLYQLTEMRIPPHASVSATVTVTAQLNKPWASKLVNAILRTYLRQQESLATKIASYDLAYYAHPVWWIEAIQQAWPIHWKQILAANNAHPPFALRVNAQHISREHYLTQLPEASIIPETTNGILLDSPLSTDQLPGFNTGDISVQDGAAQLAAPLLQLAPGQHVLDACAAPGGKLTHILEIEPNLKNVVAIEQDAKRIPLIQANLSRLQLHAQCIQTNAANIAAWWDGQLFDRILIDAPCSASGVIRRHPDIKLLRKPTDIASFAINQLYLLTQLWSILKPGGLLLYTTCSIFPAENTDLLHTFLTHHPLAQEEKIQAAWGIPCTIGRQILTGMHNMDGFYYACLRK